MNTKQENEYVAGRKLFDYLEKHLEKVKVLPRYSELYSTWSLKMVQIAILNEKHYSDHSGLFSRKNNERNDIITMALQINAALISYGIISNDEQLTETIHFTKIDLERDSDANLISDCNILYISAQAHNKELEAFGIVSSTLSTFKSLIDAYIKIIKSSINEKKELTQFSGQMAGLFDDLLAIYSTVDILVALLKKSEPEFYCGYLNSRSFDFHKGAIKVKGLVSDAETGDGLYGVNVIFILN